MIPRYSRPEMARLWSEQNKFATWLRVEIAATEVLAERGMVPREALEAIRSRARFDCRLHGLRVGMHGEETRAKSCDAFDATRNGVANIVQLEIEENFLALIRELADQR